MRSVRISIGIALWAAMLFAGLKLVDAKFEEQGQSRANVQQDVLNLATTERRFVSIESDRRLRFVVGDPVFGFVDGQAAQLGEVTGVFRPDAESDSATKVQSATTNRAEIVLYDSTKIGDAVLTHYTSPNSLAATVATLLPQPKREALALEIRNAVLMHRAEIVAELKPLLEKSIRESVGVVEDELTAALKRHREELTQLGDKYQKDLVTTEIVPLVREELLPIVRKHAEPVAEDVGKTLWDKLSLWRFGWRYIYDKSPLPERDRVRKEWQRFMQKEIVPELESRSDEIVAAIQRIFADAAKNPAVRKAVRKNLSAIIEDPEVHRIVFQILKEVMIDSPRVREVLEKTWTSPEAQRAFRLASARFEPTAIRIGELLFGTPEDGITPEFAAVLRRQILHKDQRWLVLSQRTADHRVLPDPQVLSVLSGGENTAYPGRIREARGSE